jgi:glucose-6-phosphate isomerase
MPVLMAFIEFWYTNYFNSSFLTVNAYTERLRLFPMYLQQLQMESNGKCIDINNNPVKYKTAEAVFGVTGTPAQHSYFQALHQGTNFFHTDFIGLISRETDGFEKDHNDFLFSNMLAQAKTMTIGLKSAMENEIPRYKEIPGGKPSNIILLKNWNPRTLGNLIALYEHKTFTLGNILEIDSFDQWGVERGKKIANVISEYMKTSLSSEKLDKTTINTIRYFKNQS